MCGRKCSARYPARVLLFLLLYPLSTRGDVRVMSLAHDSALLPCQFDFIRGFENLVVIWEKVEKDGSKVQVYKYAKGRSNLSGQDSQFRGRTHLSGDITQGNLDLNLTVVTMNDGGAYYCRAANNINHGDNMVELSVRAPPPEKIEKATKDNVTLVPKYFGVPNEITWKVDNRIVVELELASAMPHFYYLADRAHLDRTGHLTITNLTKEDSGLYKSQVIVIDIIQETEILLFVLDRVSKPVIDDRSTSQEVRLRCISSSSNVTYKWQEQRSGELVSTEQEYIAPKPQEDVVLICTASNTVSQDSEAITIQDEAKSKRLHLAIAISALIILVAFSIAALLCCYRRSVGTVPVIEKPSDLTVYEGDTANMSCDVTYADNEVIHHQYWHKDGSKDSLPNTTRVTVTSNSLTILSVTRNDSGLYLCRVRDDNLTVYKGAGIRLSVNGEHQNRPEGINPYLYSPIPLVLLLVVVVILCWRCVCRRESQIPSAERGAGPARAQENNADDLHYSSISHCPADGQRRDERNEKKVTEEVEYSPVREGTPCQPFTRDPTDMIPDRCIRPA